jgi:NADH-quinone oxidoreductase subunit E
MALLSEITEANIRAQVERFQPHIRTALLPSLKIAQSEIGWLPPEVIARVADLVGVSHSAAAELAGFYSMLHTHDEGHTHIEVCVQLPCAVAGGERLLRWLSEALEIEPGTSTSDGIKLERTSECFGSCNRAPMCRANDDYHEHMTPEKVQALVAQLRNRSAGATNGRVAETPAPAVTADAARTQD